MATKTWQNGGVDNNWSTPGNWVEGSKPAAGDDVIIAVAYNCVVDEATAALNSLDCTGYTATLSGTSDITVTVASGTSKVLFAGTLPSWSGNLLLNPAAGTIINLTFGTLTTAGTCGGITIAGTTTGAVYFLDNITIGVTKTITLTSGTLHTDGAADVSGLTHSWGKVVATGTVTRTLYLGTSNITITSSGDYQWRDSVSLTLYAGTSAITFNGVNVYNELNRSYYTLSYTGLGAAGGIGNFSVVNYYRTGAAIRGSTNKFDNGTITVTGEFRVKGQSISNRVLCGTNILTTAITFVLSGAVISNCQNVDFRKITFVRNGVINDVSDNGSGNARFQTSAIHGLTAGTKITVAGMGRPEYNGLLTISAVSDSTHFDVAIAYAADADEIGTYGGVDFSNITGGSGDCGGNTITGGGTVIFTTALDKYWVGNAGSWSDSAFHWALTSGGAPGVNNIPLPQDNVFFDLLSFTATSTVVVNMPRLGKTIDWSNLTQITTWSQSTNCTVYGGLNLTSLNVFTSGSNSLIFEGRSVFNLTSNGLTLYSVYIQMVGGTLILQDALTLPVGNGRTLTLTNGFLDAATNNVNVTADRISITGAAARRLDMGNGTWTLLMNTAGTSWNAAIKTLLTFNANGSTIQTTNTGVNVAEAFIGGGLAYNNITVRASAAVTTFSDNNSFGVFTVQGAKTVKFTDLSTTIVTSFVSSGNDIVLTGTAAAGWAINDTSGINSVSNCTISYSSAGGGAFWQAYTANGNVDGGGNSGWIFTSSPSSSISLSVSPSSSISLSVSPSSSISLSVSPSVSPSSSTSASISPSASESPSVSPSSSISLSVSPSSSISPSVSPSISPSPSIEPPKISVREKIRSHLESISKIQAVYDYPKLDFDSFPVAVMFQKEIRSKRENNYENLRIYSFDIALYYDVQYSGLNIAMSVLFDLVDDVLDKFDKDETLTGAYVGGKYTMVNIEPSVSQWGEVPDKKIVCAIVNLKVRASFNIT